MTKKDFEALAVIMADKVLYANDDTYGVICETVEEMAAYFASVNPRFDQKRFVQACGLQMG